MSNVSTLYQRECASVYMKDGPQDALRTRYLFSGRELIGDGLTATVSGSVAITEIAISATAVNVHMVIIESPAAATTDCIVNLMGIAGTTNPVVAGFDAIRCSSAKTRVARYWPGNDARTLYTALSINASLPVIGTTIGPLAANVPTVTVLFA